MARQDYILEALKDLKSDIQKIDSKIDAVQEKSHKLELAQDRLAKSQEVNTEDWKEHMSRTKVAERRLDLVEDTLQSLGNTVHDLQKLAENTSSSLIKIAGWITHQQERKNAQKELWKIVFLWLKRIGVVAATISAIYGGYEGIIKLMDYL